MKFEFTAEELKWNEFFFAVDFEIEYTVTRGEEATFDNPSSPRTIELGREKVLRVYTFDSSGEQINLRVPDSVVSEELAKWIHNNNGRLLLMCADDAANWDEWHKSAAEDAEYDEYIDRDVYDEFQHYDFDE